MAGKLVVVEGIDGAGTTTQAKKLGADLLSLGLSVIRSAEPTDSVIGKEIRRLLSLSLEKNSNLLAGLALCFAADRMLHVNNVIEPGLLNQQFVILDRYVMSSMVYQGIHLPTGFVAEINRFVPKPDLTLILDVPATLAFERLGRRPGDKDFYETPALLERIRSRYLHFSKSDPASIVLIDATGTVDQVSSHIMHVVRERFLT